MSRLGFLAVSVLLVVAACSDDDETAARIESLEAVNEALQTEVSNLRPLTEEVERLEDLLDEAEVALSQAEARVQARELVISDLEQRLEVIACGEDAGCEDEAAADRFPPEVLPDLMWPWDGYLSAEPTIQVDVLAPDTWSVTVDEIHADQVAAYAGGFMIYRAEVPLEAGDNALTVAGVAADGSLESMTLTVRHDPALEVTYGRILTFETEWPGWNPSTEGDTQVPSVFAGVDQLELLYGDEASAYLGYPVQFEPVVVNDEIEVGMIPLSPDATGAYFFGGGGWFDWYLFDFEALRKVFAGGGGVTTHGGEQVDLSRDPHVILLELTTVKGEIIQIREIPFG